MKTTHKLIIGSLLLCGAMLSMGTQKNLQIVPYGHKMCSRLCDFPTCKWKFYFPNFTCDITFTQLPHDAEKHSWFCQTRQSLIQTLHTTQASERKQPDHEEPHVGLFIAIGSAIYKFNSTITSFELYANTSVRYILAVAFMKKNNKVLLAGLKHIVTYHQIYGEQMFKSNIKARFLAVDQEIDTLFIIEHMSFLSTLSRIQYDGTGYVTLVRFPFIRIRAIVIDTRKKFIFGFESQGMAAYEYTSNSDQYIPVPFPRPLPQAVAIRRIDKCLYYMTDNVIYRLTLYTKKPSPRLVSRALSKIPSDKMSDLNMVYSSGRLYVTFVDGQTPYLAIVNVESKGLEKLVISNVYGSGIAKMPVCQFTHS